MTCTAGTTSRAANWPSPASTIATTVPNDRFVRLRQGFDLRARTRTGTIRDREVELGLYAIFDVVLDPATEPVAATATGNPIQAEFGFTLATRPRYRIWRFDAPRLGFGYRLAGTLSGVAIRDRRAVLTRSQAAGAYFSKGASCAASAR